MYTYIYIYLYVLHMCIIYICMRIYIYYIYIHVAINNVLDAKMVLKTHLLIKVFRLLYRSFVYINYALFSKNLVQKVVKKEPQI